MRYTRTYTLLIALALLSACGGGSGTSTYGSPGPPATTPPPSPPAAAQTNFTSFMRAQIDAVSTSDVTEPTEVETIDWVFTDDEDESEYDDVLATSM